MKTNLQAVMGYRFRHFYRQSFSRAMGSYLQFLSGEEFPKCSKVDIMVISK